MLEAELVEAVGTALEETVVLVLKTVGVLETVLLAPAVKTK